jgi:23S rRNA (cytidine1920-2'-O)/16S rRNA (cytidine1409-2'-O)-methyltransferase
MKKRIDLLLVARGLFESREKAQRAIMAGEVRVGEQVVQKPGQLMAEDVPVTVAEPPRFVGRGGEKLEGALEYFAVDPSGAVCLDVGASTGGFTDCLLQHGAARVYAVDVGHGQLDWKLRNDDRVVVREKVNARHLSTAEVPEPVSIVVMDVSFISLTLVLPPALELLTPQGVILCLIKPQFELGRKEVAKGGVVKDPALHEKAVARIEAFIAGLAGCTWEGVIESPIRGAQGNKEFLACIRK